MPVWPKPRLVSCLTASGPVHKAWQLSKKWSRECTWAGSSSALRFTAGTLHTLWGAGSAHRNLSSLLLAWTLGQEKAPSAGAPQWPWLCSDAAIQGWNTNAPCGRRQWLVQQRAARLCLHVPAVQHPPPQLRELMLCPSLCCKQMLPLPYAAFPVPVRCQGAALSPSAGSRAEGQTRDYLG